jgi:PhnB protein
MSSPRFLAAAHEPDVAALVQDEDVRIYTRVPTHPPVDFARSWLGTYEQGWRDGSRAGFAVETRDGGFLGLGLFVRLETEARQGEIGYVIAPAARGRGVATRTLRLLTDWGFSELALERIELWIDVGNPGSERVAERVGFVREGVLRSYWFKEDIRRDFGVWSRLRSDPGSTAEPTVPPGYGTVTPWIVSRDSAALIRFLEAAFGAEEIAGSRMENQDGSIAHVEVRIGDSIVMLFDSYEDWPETPAFFRLYVGNADATYQQALAAGAGSVTRVTELFWGDRVGRVRDPFGNVWWLQSGVTGVPAEELEARMQDPATLEAMRYVQQSLIDALRSPR